MKQIDRQLAWLGRHFPDLKSGRVPRKKSIFIDGPQGRVEIPVVSRPIATKLPASASYLDSERGLLVVKEKGYFIHVRLPGDSTGSSLTPHQAALMAVLLERGSHRENLTLPAKLDDLKRLLETIIGVGLVEMAVRRFVERISDISAESASRETRTLDRAKALARLESSMRERSLGKTQRYAIRTPEQVLEVVDQIGSSAIHGVSALLRDLGAVPSEDDIIVSRDALSAVSALLGRVVDPDYSGKTVLVRTPSHVRIPVLAGKANRRHLNPVLARAVARSMDGPSRDLVDKRN